jgi:hypothetical protein
MPQYCRNFLTLSLLMVSSLLFAGQSNSAISRCEVPEEVQLQFLMMSWDDFDQGDQGWRLYEKPGCYIAAGRLIDRYFETKPDLTTRDKRVLRFHAGQVYAFGGEYPLARARFLESFRAEPETDGFPWNDYVHATIAFVDRDLDKLKLHRERIAATDTKMNLTVVDNLIQFFNASYMVAYTGGKRTQ